MVGEEDEDHEIDTISKPKELGLDAGGRRGKTTLTALVMSESTAPTTGTPLTRPHPPA